jgi:hypothetical protein
MLIQNVSNDKPGESAEPAEILKPLTTSFVLNKKTFSSLAKNDR